MTIGWLGSVVVIHTLILATFVFAVIVVHALNPAVLPYVPVAMCIPGCREVAWLSKALDGIA